MLVLSRKVGESVVIDGRIEIRVSLIQGNRVKLAINAPRDVAVIRSEILDAVVPSRQQEPGELFAHGNELAQAK